MRRRLPILLALFSILLLAACGGDSEEEPAAAPESSPATTPSEETPSASEATPSEEEDAPADVEPQADEIVSCLADEGIEAKFEKADLSTYEEAGTIGVTFEYEDLGITVPDAVTLWLHDSEDAAAKTQKGINEDLLEGDTKAELVGTVVVDDFGTTLKEPEAADQAAALQSCLG